MKFLFCPLATPGFVYPAIGVALALQRRGHDVAFVTGMAFEEVLSQAGVPRIARSEEKDGPSFPVERWADPLVTAIQVKHIEHGLRRFAPDVLVGHPLSLGAHVVKERTAMPLAVLGLASYLWPIQARSTRAPSSETEGRLAWRYDDMIGYLNAARRLFKLAPLPLDSGSSPLLGDLFLLQSVPELAGDVRDYPAQVHMVGACRWEPPGVPADVSRFLEEAAGSEVPLVYVHHGRSFGSPSFWPQLVEALAGEPLRVAASVGRMDGPVGSTPETFLVRSHVPQHAVLSRARLAVSSANTTVVLGALVHGIPSVLCPGGGEQPDVAEQMARTGAAVRVDAGRLNAGDWKELVWRGLQDPALAERARGLATAFARMGGPAAAAELLERLGETQRPVLRGASAPVNAEISIGEGGR